MNKTLLVGALVLPLVALGTHFALRRPQPAEQGLRSGTFEPPREAPAFSLDGSNGNKLSLRDYLGKVVILEFGYTFCEDVCPVTLAHLTEVYKKLANAASDVQLIYVTVDPKRDSPERLREHLAAFNPSFLGATGAPDQLQATQKAYGVVARQVVSRNQALGYAVDHSSSLYLVDRQGKLRGLAPFGTPVDDIVHDLRASVEDGAMISTAAGAHPAVHPRDEDGLPAPSRSRRRRLFGIVLGAILTVVLFAAMWPVTFDSREELFEIPKGTWARRMAGEKREILPSEIHLLVGIHNVLTLKNSDDVPQTFGPTLLMPGQTLRIPFTRPSENNFSCTAHASGQLVVVVEATPTWPWNRLGWRVRRMLRWLFKP